MKKDFAKRLLAIILAIAMFLSMFVGLPVLLSNMQQAFVLL